MGIQIGGDFIGFTFGGVHSSTLGIIRTSDGSRYNMDLLPTLQDKTVQVPGRDGVYYFGSYYTQKSFNIPIAFDSLTEEQLQKLKKIFGSKVLQKLSFDERPEVFYWVKSAGTPNLKFICFGEKDGSKGIKERIYKGEGLLSFIAYDPYGYNEKVTVSSFAKSEKNTTKTSKGFSATKISNTTEIDTDWKIFIDVKGSVKTETTFSCDIWRSEGKGYVKKLSLINCKLKGENKTLEFDSKTGMVYGVETFEKNDDAPEGVVYARTGEVYNEFLKGDFFKITPKTSSILIKIPTSVKTTGKARKKLYYYRKYY